MSHIRNGMFLFCVELIDMAEEKFNENYIKLRARYWNELVKLEPDFCVQKWTKDNNGEINKKHPWVAINAQLGKDKHHDELRAIFKCPEAQRTRLKCEIVIDLDNKSIYLNRKRALEIKTYLTDTWNITCTRWFSGNKGVHVHFFMPNISRHQLLGLFFKINERFKTKIDKGIVEQKRHMIRGEYSLNSKSDKLKLPIDEPLPLPINMIPQGFLQEMDFISFANRVEDKRSYTTWYSDGARE